MTFSATEVGSFLADISVRGHAEVPSEKKGTFEEFAHQIYEEFKRNGGLSLDAKVKFDPRACLRCGGRCCFTADVLLSPYDVYRISKGGALKRLQMTFIEFTEKLCETYIGEHSKVPLVKLGKDSVRNCPFLAPAVTKGNDGKLRPVKGPTNGPIFLCAIHAFKPMKCRLYPLGHVASSEGEHGMVFQHRKDCPGCQTSSEITVREILGPDVENLKLMKLGGQVVAEASQLANKARTPEDSKPLIHEALFAVLYIMPEIGARIGKNYEEVAKDQLEAIARLRQDLKEKGFWWEEGGSEQEKQDRP